MDLLSLVIGVAIGASFPLFFSKVWTFAKEKYVAYTSKK